jgi:hypothetical protein
MYTYHTLFDGTELRESGYRTHINANQVQILYHIKYPLHRAVGTSDFGYGIAVADYLPGLILANCIVGTIKELNYCIERCTRTLDDFILLGYSIEAPENKQKMKEELLSKQHLDFEIVQLSESIGIICIGTRAKERVDVDYDSDITTITTRVNGRPIVLGVLIRPHWR